MTTGKMYAQEAVWEGHLALTWYTVEVCKGYVIAVREGRRSFSSEWYVPRLFLAGGR